MNERTLSAIGYIPVLCLIPLLLKKDSPFAQHHGKQGLVILVLWVALWAVYLLPIIGKSLWVLGSVGLLLLVILGMVNAANGIKWEMPVFGKYAKEIKL